MDSKVGPPIESLGPSLPMLPPSATLKIFSSVLINIQHQVHLLRLFTINRSVHNVNNFNT